MGKECGAWVSRRLWGGGNTSPLKTTAWEAKNFSESALNFVVSMCNRSPRANPSRDLSPRLVPSCKPYSGLVPETSPCD